MRAGVLVEGQLVCEEAVSRDGESLTNLHRLEGWKHRKLRRERVGQIVDVAKALCEPDRLRLREPGYRRDHGGSDGPADRSQKMAS